MQRARMAELPPLQSVLELTSASRPPSRQSAEATEELSAPTATGQMLRDGSGVLGDGTQWQKRSGEEFGVNGYWKRWTQLVGMSEDGTVRMGREVRGEDSELFVIMSRTGHRVQPKSVQYWYMRRERKHPCPVGGSLWTGKVFTVIMVRYK